MRDDGSLEKAAMRSNTSERREMPDEIDDDQRPRSPVENRSPVEKMIDALDEVQEAVDRLAADRRIAGRRAAHDLALLEPFSPDDSSSR
jgi:hypothetical protein